MSNAYNTKTVGAAIPADLSYRFSRYVAANGSTVSKTLTAAIINLVGDDRIPELDQRQAVINVLNARAAVVLLKKHASRTYPPNLILAARKVHASVLAAKPSFMVGDGRGEFEREHGHILDYLRGVLVKAKADADSLERQWVLQEREARNAAKQ